MFEARAGMVSPVHGEIPYLQDQDGIEGAVEVGVDGLSLFSVRDS